MTIKEQHKFNKWLRPHSSASGKRRYKAKKITARTAVDLLGISVRYFRRLVTAYRERG